jgi:futalosine hydrolase
VTALLLVTAVDAERDALLAGLGEPAGRGRFAADGPDPTIATVGVGPAAAAAGTARLLTRAAATGTRYRAVLSAGIGGGFGPRIGVGGTALATRSVAADLGADSPAGFLSLDELGFGTASYDADTALLVALRYALPEAVAGPVLTVSMTTGTAAGTAEITRRYPDAVAEAMEGFGVAVAAAGAGVAFAEIRTISNLIGPRDRGAWRIGRALAALTEAGRALGKLDW